MLLAVVPLDAWGGWAVWATFHGSHWATAALGGAALLTAGGLRGIAAKIICR
jgi:hypothetical protein